MASASPPAARRRCSHCRLPAAHDDQRTFLTHPTTPPPAGNHVGMYVAKAQGLYSAAGLDVSFLSPHSDGYKATPASRVESGVALFAVAPSESVISHNTAPPSHPKPPLKAVAALLQADTSAIVTLASSGIDRPAKLDGKRYASYGARYEGRIVQEMIKADGGSGEYVEAALPMLGLWGTVLEGKADATWVFTAWEGVQAARRGVALNAFRLGDFGIPYGYSPVLLAHPDALRSVADFPSIMMVEQRARKVTPRRPLSPLTPRPASPPTDERRDRADVVRAFLAATAAGCKFTAAHPSEAAALLLELATAECPDLPEPLDAGVVEDSVKEVAQVRAPLRCGRCCGAAVGWPAVCPPLWRPPRALTAPRSPPRALCSTCSTKKRASGA
jgi:ABC-type nitrate/sulfonate/bicarbonate transport system substrate-binding protein